MSTISRRDLARGGALLTLGSVFGACARVSKQFATARINALRSAFGMEMLP